MSAIYINGTGAVSPAGWSTAALRDAVAKAGPLAPQPLPRPGEEKPLSVLRVPAPNPRPAYFAHPRLRRASPVTQFAVSAACEAVGSTEPGSCPGLGVIVCVFSGCVNYSRRFYDEALKNPATASPLLFPETVFNAPASHISAFFSSTAINYTLVGDNGTFLAALATGAGWITEGRVAECVVVGAEELDWLTADAMRLFDRAKISSEGAGAVLLSAAKTDSSVRLEAVTDEFLYAIHSKPGALREMRGQLGSPGAAPLLVDSSSSSGRISREETALWQDWPHGRLSPRQILGEGLMAGTAWQTVLATDALRHRIASEAWISIAGFHQHAIAARLGS